MEENPLSRVKRMLTDRVLHARRGDTSLPWFLVRMARTLVSTALDFKRRKGSSHASALTFYSLLSLVPLAAMALGVSKGFGFEQLLEKELLKHFAAQQEVVGQIMIFARNLLDNTKGGLVAGVGVVALFWSVIKVLERIEDNFNQIWEVPSRPMLRKLSDYLTIMIIAPVLLIMSGSATVFIISQVSAFSSQVGLEKVFTPAISLGLAVAPYGLIWLLFTLIYLIMPNTRVRPGGAILAAVLAGSAYQLLQIGYVRFQFFVTSYNAIYGSFAALPLFLIWLQFSWIIVLFGAEIAHAFPDSEVFEPEGNALPASPAQTRLLALAVCHDIVLRFHRDKPGLREGDLVREFDISHRQARATTDLLIRAHLVCRVQSDEDSLLLQPTRDSANFTVRDVIAALDNLDASETFPQRHPKLAALSLCLQRMHIEMGASPSNALLRDIDPAYCADDDSQVPINSNHQICTNSVGISRELRK